MTFKFGCMPRCSLSSPQSHSFPEVPVWQTARTRTGWLMDIDWFAPLVTLQRTIISALSISGLFCSVGARFVAFLKRGRRSPTAPFVGIVFIISCGNFTHSTRGALISGHEIPRAKIGARTWALMVRNLWVEPISTSGQIHSIVQESTSHPISRGFQSGY